ncbi:MAG: heme-binding domain-containing protein [Acidobacteria bacterium]|nr:heme-binding domain-containing protein [Acidobacteriota bacterium]
MRKTRIAIAGAALLAAFGVLQFVQPDRTNPPFDRTASFGAVSGAPRHVAAAVERACADCHSNQTAWPWYSRISPVSWLVANDVRKGRNYLPVGMESLRRRDVTPAHGRDV